MKVLYTLLFLLTSQFISAQQWEWAKRAYEIDSVFHITQMECDLSGDLYILGIKNNIYPQPSEWIFTKYNQNGDIDWIRKDLKNFRYVFDNDGSLIIYGNFTGSYSIDSLSISSAGAGDFYIGKLDNANGKCISLYRFGTINDEYITSLGVEVDNDYVISGVCGSSFSIDSVPLTSSDSLPVFMCRMNDLGVVSQLSQVGKITDATWTIGSEIRIESNGMINMVVTGGGSAIIGNDTLIGGYYGNTHYERFDQQFQFVRSAPLLGGMDYGKSIVTKDDHFLLSFESEFGADAWASYVRDYTYPLNPKLNLFYSDLEGIRMTSGISSDSSGNIYIGWTLGWGYQTTPNYAGMLVDQFDVSYPHDDACIIAKHDLNGQVLQLTGFGFNNSSGRFMSVANRAGDVYVTGPLINGMYLGPFLIPCSGGQNRYVAKLSSSSPVSIVNGKQSSEILVYPNPAKDHFYLFGTVQKSTIDIYDVNGRLIDEIESTVNNVKINCENYKPGIYQLVIRGEKDLITKRIVIE